MSTSNAWAEIAACSAARGRPFSSMNGQGRTQDADAGRRQGGHGHGIRAKRSKSGAVSFDLLEMADAALQ